MLLIIAGNKEWHSDLGGMKRVTSELEKLSLINQGYSFCMEKMVKAIMADTAPPTEVDQSNIADSTFLRVNL